MKKFLLALAAVASLGFFAENILCSPASAQSCNSNSSWIKTFGTYNIGDPLIFGPACDQVQDGGAFAPGTPIGALTTLCNPTGAPAVALACSAAQETTLLNPFTSSLKGLVPASGGGIATFLRADGTFAVPAVGTSGSSYTSVGSMQASDCGKTVVLGGSAFYTFTVPIASGFAPFCAVVITNTDNICPINGAATCRGKNLAINGYSNFILWPGQSFYLINVNNVWNFNNPGRWKVGIQMAWHVDHANGVDTNDGLALGATGAFRTLQGCVNVMIASIDFGGTLDPNCINVAETFTENAVSVIKPLTGGTAISITGNTAAITSQVWNVSASGGLQARDGGRAVVTGFKMNGTAPGGFCLLTGGQGGLLDFGFIEFGTNTGNNDLCLTSGGGIGWSGGQVTVSGNMNDFLFAVGEGHALMDGMPLQISAVTFANFIEVLFAGVVSATSLTVTGPGAGAGSVGRKYGVSLNSVLGLNGQILPGATAGATATGGQVN